MVTVDEADVVPSAAIVAVIVHVPVTGAVIPIVFPDPTNDPHADPDFDQATVLFALPVTTAVIV
jgi:hypothetical protein